MSEPIDVNKNGWFMEYGYYHHYVNGVNHRDGGAAIIDHLSKREWWYKNGQRHREGGPAVSLFLDDVYVWYYEDQIIGTSNRGYTQKKFEQWLKFKVFL